MIILWEVVTMVENKEVAFISGPMTGLPNYNYDEFFRVEELLKELGYRVINPARIGVQDGWEWRDYMKAGLVQLLQEEVDFVVALDGYENSKGAKLEMHIAKELGVPIRLLIEFEPKETVSFRSGGVVYLENVKRPCFVYDKVTYSRVKYGDYPFVISSFNSMRKAYIEAGFEGMADDLVFVEVPANQVLIDDIFQSDGRFTRFVKELEVEKSNDRGED